MLLAKYLTKFKVSKMNEADMVKAIKKDIEEAFKEGAPAEQAMKELEVKVKQKITLNRIDSKNGSQKGSQLLSSSRRDSKSVRSVAKSVTSKASDMNEMIVFHYDPQKRLIPSDEQWNELIKKDLEKFETENESSKKQKVERSKKLQQEHLDQMKKRKEDEARKRFLDKKFFEEVGKNATEKYYVNEDKHREFKNSLKTGAKGQVEHINTIFNKRASELRDRMSREAEARAAHIQKL